jgi:FAD/FMN-containing dehydrogenase
MTAIIGTAALADSVQGAVLVAGDAEYDTARHVFNSMIDKHPAVIVQVASDADVVAAIAFAREHDLPLAVRAGGHSVVGYGVCDGGGVIDLSGLKRIVVDAGNRRVSAQGGVLWAELDAATQEHGLAVTGGRVSTTGVAGLCLGSGSGWLERMHGLTSDNLVRATVVTADGRIVNASADENDDLFWALHGGGGNFGVVTEFEFELHPVGPIVWGGLIAWPREMAGEVARAYRDFMDAAPDEVGGALAFLTAPPEPFIPVEAHGQPIVAVIAAYFGDPERGAEAFKAILELGPPAVAMVDAMPYVVSQSLIDDGNKAGNRNYWRAEFLEALPDEAIDALVEHANRITSPITGLLVAPAGGALSRVDESTTLLGHRDSPWNFHALGQWVDPAEDETHMRWARELGAGMAPWTTSGAYLNYTSETGAERVKATFGERYDRALAVKRAWDPDNVFRINQNIDPKAG